jgi:hypothetical protein
MVFATVAPFGSVPFSIWMRMFNRQGARARSCAKGVLKESLRNLAT